MKCVTGVPSSALKPLNSTHHAGKSLTCKMGKHRARETPAHTWAKQQQQQHSQARQQHAAAHLLPVFFEEQSPTATAGGALHTRSKTTCAACGVEVMTMTIITRVITDTPALHNLGIRNHVPEEPGARRQHTLPRRHTQRHNRQNNHGAARR